MLTEKNNQLLVHAMMAARNLETVILNESERERAALKLATCALLDTSRRLAFHERYALLTNRGAGFSVANEYPVDPLAGGVVDLHQHVGVKPDSVRSSVFWDGRDVSVELAAVSQLGDWTKGGGLDEELRELPQSVLLAENGLTFTDVFDDPSDAFISYRFADVGGQLLVRRSRAAGDVSHHDATEINIVKQSQFAIDESALSTIATREARNAAMQYEDVYKSDLPEREETMSVLKRKMADIGFELVEPTVNDSSNRNKNVLPVSSQYFALYQLQDK